MNAITGRTSLCELVVDQPGLAELFDALGLDYRCQGDRPLAEVCARRGLDVHTLVAVLEAQRRPAWTVLDGLNALERDLRRPVPVPVPVPDYDNVVFPRFGRRVDDAPLSA